MRNLAGNSESVPTDLTEAIREIASIELASEADMGRLTALQAAKETVRMACEAVEEICGAPTRAAVFSDQQKLRYLVYYQVGRHMAAVQFEIHTGEPCGSVSALLGSEAQLPDRPLVDAWVTSAYVGSVTFAARGKAPTALMVLLESSEVLPQSPDPYVRKAGGEKDEVLTRLFVGHQRELEMKGRGALRFFCACVRVAASH